MVEEYPDCGTMLATPVELVLHMKETHAEGSAKESLPMNPEAERPGLICALCGKRFTDRQTLSRHNLGPHYRSNRPQDRSRHYQPIY